MIAICEIDDYPRGGLEIFEILDEIKSNHPDFKMTIFAIPYEMNDENYKPIEERKDWIRLGVHGWNHEVKESYYPSRRNAHIHARKKVDKLLDLQYDFAKIFKPRAYSYSWPLIEALRQREYTISLSSNYDLLHGHHLYHKWFSSFETNIGIKATFLNNKDIKIFYGHTTEDHFDYFPRFYNKKFKKQMRKGNYQFKFSEDVSVMI